MAAKDGTPAADAGTCSLVNLREIDFRPAARVRHKLNNRVVREYARQAKLKKFPPLLLVRVDGILYCVDGRHRAEAYKLRNMTMVLCRIIDGTHDDVVRLALQSNTSNGLHRSRDDKRAAVRWAMEQYPDDSYHAIAKLCDVSRPFVKKMFEGGNVAPPPDTEPAPILAPEVEEVQHERPASDGRAELIRNTVPMQTTAPPRDSATHQNSPPEKRPAPFVDRFDQHRKSLMDYMQEAANHYGQPQFTCHNETNKAFTALTETYRRWQQSWIGDAA